MLRARFERALRPHLGLHGYKPWVLPVVRPERGGAGRNRTDDYLFCRQVPSHLATAPGRSRGNRTPACGSGDRRATTTPYSRNQVFRLSKSNKKAAFFKGGFSNPEFMLGFYPPPRPGFVVMMVLSTTCQWAHTNMRHGLPCRSRRASALGNLNILNPGTGGWTLTSDLLLTGQVP